MAFKRSKTFNGKKYYQIVRNYRNDEGKTRQEVLVHLGIHNTLEAAIEDEERKLEEHKQQADTWFTEAAYLSEELLLAEDPETKETLQNILLVLGEDKPRVRSIRTILDYMMRETDLLEKEEWIQEDWAQNKWYLQHLARGVRNYCKVVDEGHRHDNRAFAHRRKLKELRRYQNSSKSLST